MDLTGVFCSNCSWKKMYNCTTQKGGSTSFQNYFLRHLRWVYGLFQMKKRRLFARKYHFIAVSKPIKNLLILNGYNPLNISVIPNFVDFENFQPFVSRESLLNPVFLKSTFVSFSSHLICFCNFPKRVL